MRIEQIHRGALQLGLRGARLPLVVAGRILAPGRDTSDWPPVLVFDKAGACVKDLVGRATGDEMLQGLARLQRAEIDKREEARSKRASAAKVERIAEERVESRRADLEAEREALRATEAEREQQVERAEREAHDRVAREAAAKKAATRTTAAKRKKAVDERAARAESQRLQSEAEALRAEETAVAARGEILDIGKAVEAKKSARRSR